MPQSPEVFQGFDARGNSEQQTQTLPELDPNDVNIVLMGETGVGKSTFINAFVNYLKFRSLKEAIASPNIHCLIPAKFVTSDDNLKETLVTYGNDENESQILGASATQSTRSYRFAIDGRYVRLIDTPGIGDTRGLLKDEENFDRVLDALAELKSVHAFCILLKSNDNKLTIFFQYCIKQLLSRLGKSASKNVVFVYTNSRGTFYRVGNGQALIKKMLDCIKKTSKVEIPFGKQNVFCVDNEGFRLLLERKKYHIQHKKDEEKVCVTSWKKSVRVSKMILSYVTGLKPHPMQDTISINESRRLILNLCYPLVLIAKNIQDNFRNIERQRRDKNKTIQTLKIKVMELENPRLICMHSECLQRSAGIMQRRVCQDPCYLKNNVSRFLIGETEIKNCEIMSKDPLNPICLSCHHSYSFHSVVSFDTKLDLSREEIITAAIEDLENEKKTIQISLAKFAHFLSHNALTPYNDVYRQYLQILIENENSCGPNKDEDLIRSYNDLIEVHREHTKLLDDQLNQARNEDDDVKIVTAEDVLNLVQELYQLKNSGEFIRECYEKQQRVRGRIALLYTERNVDGSPEDVPNGVISNRVLITIVISIVILGYCISRCLRR